MPGKLETISLNSDYTADNRFRSILALNNMAVDMAERSCILQALQTLGDAVFLAKTVFQKYTETCCQPTAQGKLEDAYRRAANPNINRLRGGANLRAVDLMNFDPSDILYDIEEDLVLTRLIRTNECVLGFADEDFRDIPILIIMHNFAVLSLIVATNTQLQAKQANFFERATSVLTCLVNKLASRYEQCEGSLALPFIVFLSVSALNALAFALVHKGRINDADACLSTIQNLQNALSSLDFIGIITTPPKLAPCA